MKFVLSDEPSTNQTRNQDKGTILKRWLAELDGYYRQMYDFGKIEPDEIFRYLSAWTARASFMRSQIQRSESKMLQGFRTRQIDPFIEECERQFKIWSRVFSVQSLDYNMSRGQT
jgi:hypothetical protein